MMTYNETLRKDRTTMKPLTFPNGDYIEDVATIKRRVDKAKQEQDKRKKAKAEVFTPTWLCDKMINHLDNENSLKDMNFQEYVDLTYLEITCGEAPFLVSRYDTTTGKLIDINQRVGILDRKLRLINENITSEKDWFKWVCRAYQSVYGYEFQADSLFIARTNLLQTLVDYMGFRWGRRPTLKELEEVAEIISWNIWQMDGLTGCVPHTNISCEIMDWKNNETVLFKELKGGD